MPGLGKPYPGHSPSSGAGGRAPLPLTAGIGFPANENWGSQSPPARAGLRGGPRHGGSQMGSPGVSYMLSTPSTPLCCQLHISCSSHLYLPLLPPPVPGKYLLSSLPTFEPPQSSRPSSWHLPQEALSDCCRSSQSLFPPRNSQSPNVEHGIILPFSSPNSLIPSCVPSPVLCSMGQGKRNSD